PRPSPEAPPTDPPMIPSLTLPPDLAPEEQQTVEAFVSRAVRDAEADAALALRVRREHARLLRRGCGFEAALDMIAGDRAYTVSRGRAEQIVRRYGKWAA
ncbi:MAG: hypothetical protein ACPG5O_10070, partial [Pseudoalteromonas tetraodonis]